MISYKAELEKIFSYPVNIENLYKPLSKYDVVLYGAGKMGKMAVDLMRSAGIRPKYIVDKNAKGYIDGVKIVSPENIPDQDKKSMAFVICIVTLPVQPIIGFLSGLGCVDVRHFYAYSEIAFPQIMPNGWEMTALNGADRAEIEHVLQVLEHDEQSITDYLRLLWWRLRRVDRVYPGYTVLSERKYFKAPSFPELRDNEVYVDGGAHFGFTVKDFISAVSCKYEHIYAFEPDSGNLAILYENLIADLKKITVYKEALSDSNQTVKFRDNLGYASSTNEAGKIDVNAVTLDSITEIKPTIIKLHIEGDELRALTGAQNLISKYRPILMVLADHGKDGLYRIPKYLYSLDNYKLYFNLHDYCGNTSIFYAYPGERVKTNAK